MVFIGDTMGPEVLKELRKALERFNAYRGNIQSDCLSLALFIPDSKRLSRFTFSTSLKPKLR